jgi:hypothetical protein
VKRLIIVSSTTPTGRPNWNNFVWIDTTNRQIKEYTDGVWVVVTDFATEGVSGKFEVGVGNKKQIWVFENGLLKEVVDS